MNRKFAWLLVTAASLFACLATADESFSAEAAAELAATLQSYRTYQADFIQIVVNETGSRVQETNGRLKAKRPGLFYWEVNQPMAQFIASDGERVSVYDPDLEQVTIHKLDQRASSTPALLLSGEVRNLAETYRVSERQFGDKLREFTLAPRNPDSLFVTLKLSFADGVLQEMRLTDSLAQLSILSFSNVRLNQGLSDSDFTLDYPEGVDIIRDEG
ncbi:outer membrane lipoprotein chaperone LolA [Marinobacter sp. X15-166B]|uniref:outer membrane lipoprotein chaperone LolA n=1 Tax=Marinobacter sp. X15-166B TaxID=1897620 RepID=UPI00114CBF3A|nr:outer membrane lipoprotein chaperone LolA [Marinobacter sp. X15-166B]